MVSGAYKTEYGEEDEISRVIKRVEVSYDLKIKNTRWESFDIIFTRQGSENGSWHREARRAIQNAFSKPSLVNLISKDAKLVFYLSVSPIVYLFKREIMMQFSIFVLIQRH